MLGLNLATTLSCLNIESISNKRLQMIKISNQLPGLRYANPNIEAQKDEKTKAT
jgi:hypothetical protein